MKKFFKTHAKLCIAVLALALVTVGGTLALMAVSSNSVINSFTAASIDTEIKEEVGGKGTKQVSITNKGPSMPTSAPGSWYPDGKRSGEDC